LRIAGALAWLLFSVYVCWATRPVQWMSLEPPCVEAHPGVMSPLYSRDVDRIQELIDVGVPVIDGKGSSFMQDGGTIYINLPRWWKKQYGEEVQPIRTFQDLTMVLDDVPVEKGRPVFEFRSR